MCDKVEDHVIKQECINKIGKENEPEPEISLPPMPEWMDCPITEGSKLRTWTNRQQSGYKYTDPKKSRKNIGPYLKYWGPDFDHPADFTCYNSEGDKHGPFKEYNQTNRSIHKEGYYKNEKYDKELKEYANGVLHKMTTYTEGIKNGPAEIYCIFGNRCELGKITQAGPYKDNRMNGMWTFYKNGDFNYKSEFINGEVTRDEDGMNIKYK